MTKKIISVILAVLMLMCCVVTAGAEQTEKHQLRFNDDGKFRIVNICDIQDGYPLNPVAKQFIVDVLQIYTPDIVILGGDNTVAGFEDKEAAIQEICDIFIENDTYFTMVFGNHDAEQGHTREELFEMYVTYGGEYFLGYDAKKLDGNDMTGVGTHNLTVKSSDGKRTAYNLYMFDSNMYAYDEEGNRLGYDSVHPDQIEWYTHTASTLKAENGGEVVPAMAFQHIIVQEGYELLFHKSAVSLGLAGKDYDHVSYTYLPKLSAIMDGLLFEAPCPGYYNYGQFGAFMRAGDVKATFSGHDHTNSFTLTYNGIDIVNTPGASKQSYSNPLTGGCRLIELDENDLSTYKTSVITYADMTLNKDAHIADMEGSMSKTKATLSVKLAKFLSIFVRMLGVMTILFDKVG